MNMALLLKVILNTLPASPLLSHPGRLQLGFPCSHHCVCVCEKQEEMSGESAVSSAVPAATTRTTSFKGSSPSSKYVKLNVGGALYYTTMQTLTKQDTMLKAMFSGRMEVLTDSEGTPVYSRARVFSHTHTQQFHDETHPLNASRGGDALVRSVSPCRLDPDRPMRETLWHRAELPA